MSRKFTNSLVLFALGFGLATSVYAGSVRHGGAEDLVPDGKGRGEYRSNAPGRAPSDNSGLAQPPGAAAVVTIPQNGISYHKGPVMGVGTGSPVNVYYIWYGNWTGNTAPSILEPLAANIGGTPYYNINTTYTDAAGSKILNQVVFNGKTTDSYSQGTTLTDAKVTAVVSSAITSGRLPADANGVYFVLTSKDVAESSGFCTQYCGWHTYATIAQKAIKYAFVGDASRCLSACAAQATGPNGNAGADAMASVVAHELEEAVTDPQLNAWYDSSGYENADKCAWTFGATKLVANGAKYNQTIGGLNYLLQQNWVNAVSGTKKGYCASSY